MIKSQDIKNGTCIRMDGQLYFCIEFLHVKPGKGNTIMRTKLKNVVTGRVIENDSTSAKPSKTYASSAAPSNTPTLRATITTSSTKRHGTTSPSPKTSSPESTS